MFGLEDLGRLVGLAVGEDLGALDAPAARQLGLAVRELDLGDRGRPVAVAAGGDRPVRGGHLERRDALLEAAERLGRVALHVLALDAHVDRRVGDVLGPEVERELDEDRVVRPQRGLEEVHVAAARAAVGLDLERRAVARVVDAGRRDRRVARAVGVDAVAQRRHQRHRLERRARLALALGGEVELGVGVVARRGHREDVAVARVDRHQRRGRPDVAELRGDRLARLALLVEVDRRVDDEAAELDRRGRRTP